MRYIIVGAGAIGGVLAARLGQFSSEHPPVCIARGDNAEAIRASGMLLRTPDGSAHVPLTVATEPGDVTLAEDDVLVFATKTQQVGSALADWVDQPVHDAAGGVVSTAGESLPVFMALNGVESERLALRLFRRVFGVCVWLPSVHLTSGDVVLRIGPSSGVFIIGRYGTNPDAAASDRDASLLRTLRSDWERSTFTVHAVDDVMRWKYLKLLGNLGNAIEALAGRGDESAVLMAELRAEARGILDAAGIEVSTDAEERAWRGDAFSIRPVPGVPAELGGSSWQSMKRGTGNIESDYLNGEIALLARTLGLRAPLNEAVQAIARQAAASRQDAGSLSVPDLRARIAEYAERA